MRAEGYCLNSSVTVLVFTLANGVWCLQIYLGSPDSRIHFDTWQLDHSSTRKCVQLQRGKQRRLEWAMGKIFAKSKIGSMWNQNSLRSSICMKYGWRYSSYNVVWRHLRVSSDSIAKPRGNLQLLYKVAPMAFVVHHAGGKAMDEDGQNLLDMKPKRIHQKSPCFMGSPHDLEELEKYLTVKTLESWNEFPAYW